jgi:hypothetical protein
MLYSFQLYAAKPRTLIAKIAGSPLNILLTPIIFPVKLLR